MGRQVFFFQVSVLIARQQNEASPRLQLFLVTNHTLFASMFLFQYKKCSMLLLLFSHSPLLRAYF